MLGQHHRQANAGPGSQGLQRVDQVPCPQGFALDQQIYIFRAVYHFFYWRDTKGQDAAETVTGQYWYR